MKLANCTENKFTLVIRYRLIFLPQSNYILLLYCLTYAWCKLFAERANKI